MTKRWGPVRDERGQAATFSVVVTVVVVLLAAVLVWRVAALAEAINRKAAKIQQTAVPINRATDAVINIPETNRLATSILTSAKPLEGELAEIIRLAKAVEPLAGSINATAATIDDTAKGIDAEAARILPVGRAILNDVRLINGNLDGSVLSGTSVSTRGIAARIDGDTDAVRDLARLAHTRAACIDMKLAGIPVTGGAPADSAHC
ncbi:MAG: hypothetical protein M3396_04720 [Actinomycetota bacterium]|nr:hypothetical protein [Actinomycetota bacterium]